MDTHRSPSALLTLLAELSRVDVTLRVVDGDRIEVKAPRGRLSEDLRGRIARHKPELVNWLGRPAAEQESALPIVVADPARADEPFPLSDLQASFLMGSREGMQFHVRPHQYLEVDLHDLDPARLAAAFNRALRRQRANLVVVRDDMTLQAVADPEPLRIGVTDLRDLPDEPARERIELVRARMSRHELPLDRWPWLEVHICLYGDRQARLHYNNNNLFNDAMATSGLLTTVMRYYHDPELSLPDLRVSYRDCVLALAALEESPRGLASKEYWTRRLPDLPDAPDLPQQPGADPYRRSCLRRRELILPAELWAPLKQRAREHGVTPTNACYGVYAEVLAGFSGSRHFLINNMITHRLPMHPQINEVMGNFSSLYPLEVDWRHDEPFADRVRRLQEQVLSDMRHIYWSGVKVLQALNQVRRTPGRAVCPYAIGSALFVGATERPYHGVLETPQVSLDCELWELPDGAMWMVWDVVEEMFPRGLIDAAFEACRSMLTALAEDRHAWRRHAFDLLPATDRALRDRLNRPGTPPRPGLLHDGLAARLPDRAGHPAVIDHERVLDYAALDAYADRVAAGLGAAGVSPGDLVAVVLPKGWRQVVAVCGILAAGAAYVPIDPAWPDDRIRLLLVDTKAAGVLCDDAGRARLTGLTSAAVLTVDAATTPEPAGTRPPAPPCAPDDLAYVIFTSGSTGRPKGAMLDHRGPRNTIEDINRRYGVGPDDVVLGVSSLCFDLSVYDVFGTLDAGATLVYPAPEQTDPASWVGLAAERRVSVWNAVPALTELFVAAALAAGVTLPDLRLVLLSGDWIPVELPERIARVAPAARVVGLGGATEASIWSIHYPIDEPVRGRPSVPYGTPLTNQAWYVRDETGRDAPVWVPGDLYIGGVGVALGYLGDAERTAASFPTDPITGRRLYRTGDRGRYLPDGTIEFLGRADLQVKINGFRVEPGEIEHALLEHPRVRRAAVVARTAGQGRQLAGFVTGPDLDGAAGSELRDHLAARLPAYLVPSYLAVLDELPLSPNGKLDRAALAKLGTADDHAAAAFTAPRTPTELALADIWSEVLDITRVGVHDDFFTLGGQSFAALRVTGLIEQRLGRRLPLGALLELRTVARLAARLDRPDVAWSPLVRLTGGERPGWFLVHPAGGNVLCYRGLAAALPGACHGLQAGTGADAPATVPGMAAAYAEALLAAAPHGPYRLGGWSSGAVIAFELAHQLERRGHVVEQLVLIDAPAPVAPRDPGDRLLAMWFLEDLNVGFDAAAAMAEPADAEGGDALKRAVALARSRGGAPDLDATALAPAFDVFRRVVKACDAYLPPTVDAGVTVIRARDGRVSEFADHPCAEPHWGWAGLTRGATTVEVLPGTHHTMLTDAHLPAVAAAFAASGTEAAATAAHS